MTTPIDIIIPVHDTPATSLDDCFTSLIRQAHGEWNAIVVDDGSDEETASHLDCLAKRETRIVVYHRPNKGVSAARNYGLTKARAPYIAFVDADDILRNSFLKEALEMMNKHGLDQVIGATKVTGGEKARVHAAKECRVVDVSNDPGLLQLGGYLLSYHTNRHNEYLGTSMMGRVFPKVFRRPLLNGIAFDESLSISEDTVFAIDALMNSKLIGVAPSIWYEYRNNPFSTTGSKRNLANRIRAMDNAAKAFGSRKGTRPVLDSSFDFRIAMILRRMVCLAAEVQGGEMEYNALSKLIEVGYYTEARRNLCSEGYRLSSAEWLFIKRACGPFANSSKALIDYMRIYRLFARFGRGLFM